MSDIIPENRNKQGPWSHGSDFSGATEEVTDKKKQVNEDVFIRRLMRARKVDQVM